MTQQKVNFKAGAQKRGKEIRKGLKKTNEDWKAYTTDTVVD